MHRRQRRRERVPAGVSVAALPDTTGCSRACSPPSALTPSSRETWERAERGGPAAAARGAGAPGWGSRSRSRSGGGGAGVAGGGGRSGAAGGEEEGEEEGGGGEEGGEEGERWQQRAGRAPGAGGALAEAARCALAAAGASPSLGREEEEEEPVPGRRAHRDPGQVRTPILTPIPGNRAPRNPQRERREPRAPGALLAGVHRARAERSPRPPWTAPGLLPAAAPGWLPQDPRFPGCCRRVRVRSRSYNMSVGP